MNVGSLGEDNRIALREPVMSDKNSHSVTTLGIVGSRNWPDPQFMVDATYACLRKYDTITTIVSGGCPQGPDRWAADQFKDHDEYDFREYLPAHQLDPSHERYREYQVSNYHERNTLIAEDSDILLAFCFEGSSGTMDTVDKARSSGKVVHVFTENHLKSEEK